MLRKDGIVKEKDEAEDIKDPQLKRRIERLRQVYETINKESNAPPSASDDVISWIREQPALKIVKAILIAICHALLCYSMRKESTADVVIILALIAFMIRFSSPANIDLIKTRGYGKLVDGTLLMNEFAIVILSVAYYCTKAVPFSATYLMIMVGFSYIEDMRAFPTRLFRWVLLLFVLIQTYLYIRFSMSEYMTLPFKVMVIWTYFLLKLAVSSSENEQT